MSRKPDTEVETCSGGVGLGLSACVLYGGLTLGFPPRAQLMRIPGDRASSSVIFLRLFSASSTVLVQRKHSKSSREKPSKEKQPNKGSP